METNVLRIIKVIAKANPTLSLANIVGRMFVQGTDISNMSDESLIKLLKGYYRSKRDEAKELVKLEAEVADTPEPIVPKTIPTSIQSLIVRGYSDEEIYQIVKTTNPTRTEKEVRTRIRLAHLKIARNNGVENEEESETN